MIKKGTTNIINVYKGTTKIEKVYKGTTLIYSTGILPSGYTQCTYLQSTGTQYINTGIKGKSDLKVEIELEATINPTKQGYFGSRTATNVGSFIFLMSSTKYRSDFNTSLGNININPTTLATYPRFKIIKDKNITTIENNAFSDTITYATFNNNLDMYLFALNTGGTAGNISSIKVFSFKVYDNDNLIQNLIPCLDNNNVPCMYDSVSKNTLYNIGSGTFNYE